MLAQRQAGLRADRRAGRGPASAVAGWHGLCHWPPRLAWRTAGVDDLPPRTASQATWSPSRADEVRRPAAGRRAGGSGGSAWPWRPTATDAADARRGHRPGQAPPGRAGADARGRGRRRAVVRPADRRLESRQRRRLPADAGRAALHARTQGEGVPDVASGAGLRRRAAATWSAWRAQRSSTCWSSAATATAAWPTCSTATTIGGVRHGLDIPILAVKNVEENVQ